MDTGNMGVIADRFEFIMILQWVSFFVLLAFLGALGIMLLKFWKGVQDLRNRRIQPLVHRGKSLAKDGKETAAVFVSRGKRILEIGIRTAEALEMRAQTTTRIMKGAIPEAKKLPGEVAETTKDLQDTIKKVETTANTLKAVRGARAAFQMAQSLREIARSISDAKRGVQATGPSGNE